MEQQGLERDDGQELEDDALGLSAGGGAAGTSGAAGQHGAGEPCDLGVQCHLNSGGKLLNTCPSACYGLPWWRGVQQFWPGGMGSHFPSGRLLPADYEALEALKSARKPKQGEAEDLIHRARNCAERFHQSCCPLSYVPPGQPVPPSTARRYHINPQDHHFVSYCRTSGTHKLGDVRHHLCPACLFAATGELMVKKPEKATSDPESKGLAQQAQASVLAGNKQRDKRQHLAATTSHTVSSCLPAESVSSLHFSALGLLPANREGVTVQFSWPAQITSLCSRHATFTPGPGQPVDTALLPTMLRREMQQMEDSWHQICSLVKWLQRSGTASGSSQPAPRQSTYSHLMPLSGGAQAATPPDLGAPTYDHDAAAAAISALAAQATAVLVAQQQHPADGANPLGHHHAQPAGLITVAPSALAGLQLAPSAAAGGTLPTAQPAVGQGDVPAAVAAVLAAQAVSAPQVSQQQHVQVALGAVRRITRPPKVQRGRAAQQVTPSTIGTRGRKRGADEVLGPQPEPEARKRHLGHVMMAEATAEMGALGAVLAEGGQEEQQEEDLVTRLVRVSGVPFGSLYLAGLEKSMADVPSQHEPVPDPGHGYQPLPWAPSSSGLGSAPFLLGGVGAGGTAGGSTAVAPSSSGLGSPSLVQPGHVQALRGLFEPSRTLPTFSAPAAGSFIATQRAWASSAASVGPGVPASSSLGERSMVGTGGGLRSQASTSSMAGGSLLGVNPHSNLAHAVRVINSPAAVIQPSSSGQPTSVRIGVPAGKERLKVALLGLGALQDMQAAWQAATRAHPDGAVQVDDMLAGPHMARARALRLALCQCGGEVAAALAQLAKDRRKDTLEDEEVVKVLHNSFGGRQGNSTSIGLMVDKLVSSVNKAFARLVPGSNDQVHQASTVGILQLPDEGGIQDTQYLTLGENPDPALVSGVEWTAYARLLRDQSVLATWHRNVRLAPGAWLCSNVVAVCMQLLGGPTTTGSDYAFICSESVGDTFILGFSAPKARSPAFPLGVKYHTLPWCCIAAGHWWLLVLDHAQGRCYVYDPFQDPAFLVTAQQRVKALMAFLAWADTYKYQRAARKWTLASVPGPTQTDGYNCGVYVVMQALWMHLEGSPPGRGSTLQLNSAQAGAARVKLALAIANEEQGRGLAGVLQGWPKEPPPKGTRR